MSEFDDDDFVSNDFYSVVGNAQLNELRAVEKQREIEREKMNELAEDQESKAMTLMQIVGLRTAKELEVAAEEKNVVEDQRMRAEETKRKEQANAQLVNQFPPPNLTHS